MKKYLFATSLLVTSMFVGCVVVPTGADNTNNEPTIDVTTPDVVKPDNTIVDVIEPDEPDITVVEPDEPDDDNLGIVDVAEGHITFDKYDSGLGEILGDDNTYGDNAEYYMATIPYADEEKEVKVIVVELNEAIYLTDGLCGDLWVVTENNNYMIGTEDYYEYFNDVDVWETDANEFFILNYADSAVNANGYVFGVDKESGAFNVYYDMPRGTKSFSIFGEVVVIEESYSQNLMMFEDGTGAWTGHVWMPHLCRFNGELFYEYNIEEITYDRIFEVARFDDSDYTDNGEELFKCFLREDGALIVETIKEDGFDGYDFNTYFYQVALSDWIFQESVPGLYEPLPYEEVFK